jgi:hypothetical protein
MRKTLSLIVAVTLAGAGSTASPQVVLSSSPGTDPYSGPVPTYDFESPAPVSGGLVTTGSVSGVTAQPYGSTGDYLTVGPTNGSEAFLDLSSFASIGSLSFIWGSVDAYNVLDILDRSNNLIASFTGADAAVNPNGDQTNPITNPLALLTFTGMTRGDVGGIRFSSGQNAFEIDNVAVMGAVPEPAAWLMMLLGFGFVGGMMRYRNGSSRAGRKGDLQLAR